MLDLSNVKNIIGHLNTVNRHRLTVCRHCFKAGIYWRGLVHDLSKYSPEEFIPSAVRFQGNRSPNEAEREEYGYSTAWMHHKGRNKHHFEYWTDYSPETRLMEPVQMPLTYVIEMFCDRVAAGKIYNGDKYTDSSPLEYFNRAKGRRIIEENTSKLLEKLLVMLSTEGEEKTFAYIRSLRRRALRRKK